MRIASLNVCCRRQRLRRCGPGARPEAVVAAAEARDEIFAIVATNIDQHMDLFLRNPEIKLSNNVQGFS